MVATRMHERYLMPGLTFGALVAAFRTDFIPSEIALATVFTLNAIFILVGFYGGHHHSSSLAAARVLSAAGVAAFAFAGARYVVPVQPALRA